MLFRSEGDSVLWVLPMAYHFVVSILTYVRFGITLVLPEDDSPESLLVSAREHSPTMLYASPPVVQSLACATSQLQLPATMRVVSTSSCLYPQHAHAFVERFGIAVEQFYGLFEVGLPIGSGAAGQREAASVGSGLPQYEVEIGRAHV